VAPAPSCRRAFRDHPAAEDALGLRPGGHVLLLPPKYRKQPHAKKPVATRLPKQLDASGKSGAAFLDCEIANAMTAIKLHPRPVRADPLARNDGDAMTETTAREKTPAAASPSLPDSPPSRSARNRPVSPQHSSPSSSTYPAAWQQRARCRRRPTAPASEW